MDNTGGEKNRQQRKGGGGGIITGVRTEIQEEETENKGEGVQIRKLRIGKEK